MSSGTDDKPPRNTVVVNGIDTRMPIAISIGNAVSEVANHSIGRSITPSWNRVAFSIPAWPFRVQRHTIAVMVSEIAHGSITITRARPRPAKSSFRISATGTEMMI